MTTPLQGVPTASEPSFCAQHLYQMPWSDTDNAMAWLEVTRECDLSCEYCCQDHQKNSTKPLDTLRTELNVLVALRNCDTIIISGGEPLLHPELVEVVKMVKAKRKKPVLLTNGIRLSRARLRQLVDAGLFGVTFHVDSKQERPGWEHCNEIALNGLREQLARLVAEFDIHCAFNTVVFPGTLNDVPDIVRWSERNADIVHVMMFIAVRTSSSDDPWEYYVDGKRISIGSTAYASSSFEQSISSHDLYDQIQKVFPGYRFNSFLGGTARAGILKWAMGNHLCRKGTRLGNLGPAAVGFLQRLGKRLTGRYVSHLSPRLARNGWAALFLGLLDTHTRKAFWKHVATAAVRPLNLFRKLHLQTFIVMQPVDFLPSGGQDHCDGCPNMTVFQGQLVRGCEVESYLSHGGPFTTVPKRLPNSEQAGLYRITLLPPNPICPKQISKENWDIEEIVSN